MARKPKEAQEAPAVQTEDIKDFKQDAHNFNKGRDEGQRLIEKSFSELGAGRSILVDRNNNIIAGNKSQKAAIKAGIKRVRVIETDGKELIAVRRTDVDIDSEEGRKLALADNSTTAANLDWDIPEMESELDRWGIDAEEWGVPDFGDGTVEAVEGEDDAPEANADEPPDSERGAVYALGNHRLMCGDSTSAEDFKTLMDGEPADMVFTDPPYGVAIGDKNKALNEVQKAGSILKNIENDTLGVDELYEVLTSAMVNVRENCKADASYFVCAPPGGDFGQMMMMMMMMNAGLRVRHQIVWRKDCATFSLGRLDYDYQHEAIMYTWTDSHHNYRKGKFRTSVWDIPKPRKCDLHPTMKPVALVENAILDGTKAGMVVLDAFGGSGTTAIACEKQGRVCRMMELDPHYCDVIRRRWAEFVHGEGCDWKALTPKA